jgi:hypothetical protein
MKTTAAALVLAGLLTGCTGADASRIEVTRWDVAPQTPAIGVPARATVALHDGRGPLRRARLEVEAHMAHPGMTPVIVPAHERDGGLYEGEIRFTMSGRWTIVASATLPDGTRVTRPLGGIDVP